MRRIHWVEAVLYNYGRHALFNEIVMVRAEEPSVGIVVVEKDITALGGCSGHIIAVKHALSAAEYDHIFGQFGRADALEIQVRDRLLHGDGGMRAVVLRTEKAALLGRGEQEYDGTVRPLRELRELAGGQQESGHAGPVVRRPVVDRIAALVRRTDAEVIPMGAHDYGLVGLGPSAEDGRDVAGLLDVIAYGHTDIALYFE